MSPILDRLDALRADTPGVQHVNHFNYAGSALPPNPVHRAVIDHLELEATIGGYEAAAQAHDRLTAVYDSIATLLNASSEEIALVENATRGWDMGVYAIPFKEGDRVLTTSWEYASNMVALVQIKNHFGIEIEVVPNDDAGQIDLAGLEHALQKPTAGVFITHVPTNNGLVQPAEEIGRLIRQHQPDAWYVLDACQSIGQLPIDVEAIQCDILSATSRKYLRGPRGAGFIYVRKDRIPHMEPPLLDLHAADLISPTEYRIRPDARRFENWESYIAGRLGLGAAVDYALEVGLDAIWQRVQQQGALLRENLLAVDGVRVHDVGNVQGGIVTFSRENVKTERLHEILSAEKINTSISNIYITHLDPEWEDMGTYIRASLHYLTTDEEIEELVDVVKRVQA